MNYQRTVERFQFQSVNFGTGSGERREEGLESERKEEIRAMLRSWLHTYKGPKKVEHNLRKTWGARGKRLNYKSIGGQVGSKKKKPGE